MNWEPSQEQNISNGLFSCSLRWPCYCYVLPSAYWSLELIASNARRHWMVIQGFTPAMTPHFWCSCSLAIDNLSIKQQLYTYSFFEHSPYAGLPSADIEEAWGRLLEPMSIRVSENELIRNNQTSVPLPDGGGFLAWLEIFHELHCVVSAASGDREVCLPINWRKFCGSGSTRATISQISPRERMPILRNTLVSSPSSLAYSCYWYFWAIRSLFRSDQSLSDVPAGYQIIDNVLLGWWTETQSRPAENASPMHRLECADGLDFIPDSRPRGSCWAGESRSLGRNC